ncbi:MAG: hypothetical protein U0414_22435 [Polyangiaceae bacterium]
MAAAGGRARGGRTRLAASLSIGGLDADPAFAPYRRAADAFRVAQCAEIAQTEGGGVCGTGPSSMVASAALALAASRYLYDTAGGDPAILKAAADMADKSRQALLTATGMAARAAQNRPKLDSIEAARRRLGVGK